MNTKNVIVIALIMMLFFINTLSETIQIVPTKNQYVRYKDSLGNISWGDNVDHMILADMM